MPQTIKCEELNEYRISIRLSKYSFISWMSLSVGMRGIVALQPHGTLASHVAEYTEKKEDKSKPLRPCG
jgi:hypothetical protein